MMTSRPSRLNPGMVMIASPQPPPTIAAKNAEALEATGQSQHRPHRLDADCEPLTLNGVLDMIHDAGAHDRVSVGELLDTAGSRSAGPLLLIPSLIIVSPASNIPGAATMAAIVIVLVALQMIMGHTRLWVPDVIGRRTVTRQRMRAAVGTLRPVARTIDRMVWPRLTVFTRRPFNLILAGACIVMASAMPPLELVPMSSTILASAIALMALALTAHDGLLALLSLAVASGAVVLGLNLLF